MKTRSLAPIVVIAAIAPLLISLRAGAHAMPIAIHRELSAGVVSEDAQPVLKITETEASASAVSSASPPPKPTLRHSLTDSPPPREKSAAPSVAEWKDAEDLAIETSTSCHARRLREWVRVICNHMSAQEVALIAGDRADTRVNVWKKDPQSFGDTAESITFALRPGDRRVFTITSAEFTRYAGDMPVTAAMLTESWVKDEPTPEIALSE